MAFNTLLNSNAGTVYRFEQWQGQLIRPQKVLDVFNRLGRTGDVAQIVYTKPPDSFISAIVYSQSATVKATVASLNALQGTIVNINDKDETYTRVLVKYSSCASRAIPPTKISATDTASYNWIIICQFILAVQPED